jgi:hypothetical protein
MNNNEILTHLERVSYASIIVDTVKLGPGRPNWEAALQQLTPEQRAILEEKIERFDTLLSRRNVTV